MLIGGSRKMIVYDDLVADEKVKIYDKGILTDDPERIYETLVQYRIGDALVPVIPRTEALLVECRHFVNCIESDAKPISDGKFGLEIVRLLESADISLRSGGIPVGLVN